ncbi:sulfatase-like hydrolase/transferase [Nonomuraea angiospora]|uniref:sulfatase-like hydrolase/transferase n=1 Tax=Nonomuraea angiospora TaxID=46172 RepID=UPI0029A7287C|nr:sulfatase-like hydrolase/transferase [Nonomuraea angiospora]MDX3102490.1 sulfatase-like hydrolase/transferase [Nonomuraea angiospora]
MRTPRLDALAASGALLTQDVPTLASALREVGYHTELVGKWHLGLTPESRAEAHGFARTFGHLAGAVDYYSHIHYSPNNRRVTMNGETYVGTPLHDLWENGDEVYLDGEYLTDLVAERATRAVREAATARSPFFLYVPFNAPHYPLHAPAKYKERFAHLPWDQMIMAAMSSALDDAVGAVMDELERQGVLDNTLVLYMSDNGPSREIRNWMDGTQTPIPRRQLGRAQGPQVQPVRGRDPRAGHREPAPRHPRGTGDRGADGGHGRVPHRPPWTGWAMPTRPRAGAPRPAGTGPMR